MEKNKTKNILYWAIINKDEIGSGVNKKILGQIKAFSLYFNVFYPFIENGFLHIRNESESIQIGKISSSVFKQVSMIKLIVNYYMANKTIIPDFIYARYPLSSYSFLKLLKFFYKNKSKIFLEIPTYPYISEMRGKSLLHKTQYVIDFILKGRLKKFVIHIVITNGKYKQIYGIPTIKIENGYDIEKINYAEKTQKAVNTIDIISVSSVEIWHGIDRFIYGMNNDASFIVDKKIYLHVVGNGPQLTFLKNIVSDKIKKHVIFHGAKIGSDLENIYKIADIGLSSLGLFRINLEEASVLKTREYIARGIPMVIGYKETSLLENPPFVLFVENNNTCIDIKMVWNFYEQIKDDNDMIIRMKSFAEENYSWKTQMLKVIKEMCI